MFPSPSSSLMVTSPALLRVKPDPFATPQPQARQGALPPAPAPMIPYDTAQPWMPLVQVDPLPTHEPHSHNHEDHEQTSTAVGRFGKVFTGALMVDVVRRLADEETIAGQHYLKGSSKINQNVESLLWVDHTGRTAEERAIANAKHGGPADPNAVVEAVFTNNKKPKAKFQNRLPESFKKGAESSALLSTNPKTWAKALGLLAGVQMLNTGLGLHMAPWLTAMETGAFVHLLIPGSTGYKTAHWMTMAPLLAASAFAGSQANRALGQQVDKQNEWSHTQKDLAKSLGGVGVSVAVGAGAMLAFPHMHLAMATSKLGGKEGWYINTIKTVDGLEAGIKEAWSHWKQGKAIDWNLVKWASGTPFHTYDVKQHGSLAAHKAGHFYTFESDPASKVYRFAKAYQHSDMAKQFRATAWENGRLKPNPELANSPYSTFYMKEVGHMATGHLEDHVNNLQALNQTLASTASLPAGLKNVAHTLEATIQQMNAPKGESHVLLHEYQAVQPLKASLNALREYRDVKGVQTPVPWKEHSQFGEEGALKQCTLQGCTPIHSLLERLDATIQGIDAPQEGDFLKVMLAQYQVQQKLAKALEKHSVVPFTNDAKLNELYTQWFRFQEAHFPQVGKTDFGHDLAVIGESLKHIEGIKNYLKTTSSLTFGKFSPEFYQAHGLTKDAPFIESAIHKNTHPTEHMKFHIPRVSKFWELSDGEGAAAGAITCGNGCCAGSFFCLNEATALFGSVATSLGGWANDMLGKLGVKPPAFLHANNDKDAYGNTDTSGRSPSQ